MARRLTWLAVGVVLTVVVVRKGRAVVDTYLPAGTTDAIDGAQRVTRAVTSFRSTFATAMAQREQELRHDLVGDVDVDALRAERPERVANLRSTWSARSAHRDPDAAGPTEDPDDDDGYTFF